MRVAVDEAGTLVGFISTGPYSDDDTGERIGGLGAIYLLEELWGRGIGTLLHDAGVALLRRQFPEAVLWVVQGNARARAFYQRCGWQADGGVKREQISDFFVDEVRYRLRF